MASTSSNPFGARDTFDTGNGRAGIYRIRKLTELGLGDVDSLPYSIRILLEAALRTCDGYAVREEDVKNLAAYNPANPGEIEIPFLPARVILQDFTGVPAVVDLAAMRSAMKQRKDMPHAMHSPVAATLSIARHRVQSNCGIVHYGSPFVAPRQVVHQFRSPFHGIGNNSGNKTVAQAAIADTEKIFKAMSNHIGNAIGGIISRHSKGNFRIEERMNRKTQR